MSATKARVLVVTPLLPPSPGGGGVYTQLLVHGLLDRGLVDFAAVLTERHPAKPGLEILKGGRLHLLRHFPFRAGAASAHVFRYVQYLLQNLQFLAIAFHVKRMGITHLLVHSSFHNHPNLMWLAMWLVGRLSPATRRILDVRDPKLQRNRFGQIAFYWKIVCCSENIVQHFSGDTRLANKLVHIPVIIDVAKPAQSEIDECKKRYGLEGTGYIFNGSGIYRDKGTDAILGVVLELQKDIPGIRLVIAGRRRDWSEVYDMAEAAGWLEYVGVIPHRDVMLLSAGALADVNMSHVDSMPRASLEALMCGAQVLLPQGVPEFERSCPDSVVVSQDVSEVAAQLRKVMQGEIVADYDESPHAPSRVLDLYGVLFDDAFREAR